MIVTLQYCIGFCHTSTLLSHGYTYVPSLLNLPPTFQPIPLLTEPWFEFPDSYSKFPLAIYFTYGNVYQFSSIQFSRSVVSDSLQPHGLQHAGIPCPSPTPRVYSNSCPSSQWCHPTISSSIIPVSSLLQLFLALGSFPKSQFFQSGGQSIGVSALASFLPMNIQDWFPFNEYSGLISFRIDWLDLLAVQGTQEIFPFYSFHSSHPLPTCDRKSVLYVIISIAALWKCSSVPSFYNSYMCVNIWYFSISDLLHSV